MARKCFISFKQEDEEYKRYISEQLTVELVDRSLETPIDSDDDDYILRKIREDYLSDSTVTIHLIGEYGAENRGWHEQRFIKRELQASLYNGSDNSKSGILGIVLPSIHTAIYKGQYTCPACGETHNNIGLNNSTTILEFSYNYFIPNGKCSWPEEDRYCILTPWDEFVANPSKYIEQAFDKRESEISKHTKVRPE